MTEDNNIESSDALNGASGYSDDAPSQGETQDESAAVKSGVQSLATATDTEVGVIQTGKNSK